MTSRRILPLLLAAAFGAALPATASAQQKAKNIIFFLGDGMGPSVTTAARIYRGGEDSLLHFERLMERTARIKTYSLDYQTTDSAPSMGSYMTGMKLNNDVISQAGARTINPTKDGVDQCGPNNGTPAVTILELAKARGRATGAISVPDKLPDNEVCITT